jgi:hypothetical protein
MVSECKTLGKVNPVEKQTLAKFLHKNGKDRSDTVFKRFFFDGMSPFAILDLVVFFNCHPQNNHTIRAWKEHYRANSKDYKCFVEQISFTRSIPTPSGDSATAY